MKAKDTLNTMNYFTLYEIPVSLKVDAPAILKKYYQLSKQYHPDHFTLEDQASQHESERMSALINEARNVLEKPSKRLEYILKEQGIIEEDEKYNLPADFLGDMMDINEELMEIEMMENAESLQTLKDKITNTEDMLFEQVRPLFEQPELQMNASEAARLKDYFYKKKYLQRITEQLLRMS